MVNKIKNEYNRLMNDDSVEYFGYIIDKNNDELVYLTSSQLDNLRKKYQNPTIEKGASALGKLLNDNEHAEIVELEKIMNSDRVVIECAKTLMDQNSFDVSINKLLSLICEFYGGEHACLFERDYKTKYSNVTYKHHIVDDNLINPEYTKSFKFNEVDVWTSYLKDNNYAFLQRGKELDSSLKNSKYCQRFIESNRENILVVSLNDSGKILGAIEIDNITQNIENVELITTICAFIVNNLYIKNVNDNLQKNVSSLENKNILNNTILECVETLVYDDDIKISMSKLLDVISNYFDSSSTNIFYKNQNSDILDCTFSYAKDGNVDAVKIQGLPLTEVKRLFNAFGDNGVGFINCVNSVDGKLKEDFQENFNIMKEKNINTLLFAPLFLKNEIVGFIGIENPAQNIKESHLVKTIANFVVNQISKNELLNKLEKLSYMDSLTNLYNRNFYNNFVDEFNQNPRSSIGVVFADVNGLKKANDSFGHELGDKLIKWAAKFLKSNLNGLIFRIGGDEFVCIQENINQSDFNSSVNSLINKINSLSELHISIGSHWADNSPNIEQVVATADELMYEQKKLYYKNLTNDNRSVKDSLNALRSSIEKISL